MPVHPHVCGENCLHASVRLQIGGSPPRVWGKLAGATSRTDPRWFTPTCVGKTRRQPYSHFEAMVHPHVCGENGLARTFSTVYQGSPPRVWGKPSRPCGSSRSYRFTPTCVGKTCAIVTKECLVSVHPHVCGENLNELDSGHAIVGSPPRVWGKLGLRVVWIPAIRFTPTCVGKTCQCIGKQPDLAVHPHVCGENLTSFASHSSASGSPPRVWGKLLRGAGLDNDLRFTPTCVGKT